MTLRGYSNNLDSESELRGSNQWKRRQGISLWIEVVAIASERTTRIGHPRLEPADEALRAHGPLGTTPGAGPNLPLVLALAAPSVSTDALPTKEVLTLRAAVLSHR